MLVNNNLPRCGNGLEGYKVKKQMHHGEGQKLLFWFNVFMTSGSNQEICQNKRNLRLIIDCSIKSLV